jgi:uncharacterized protein YehS (DUF1456 family)
MIPSCLFTPAQRHGGGDKMTFILSPAYKFFIMPLGKTAGANCHSRLEHCPSPKSQQSIGIGSQSGTVNMMNNDVLRSVRYMLDLNDAKLVSILALADTEVTTQDIVSYLKKEDEEGFVPCPDEVMANFLNGLIFFRRGKDDAFPAPDVELPVTNNIILKKLRVAFELKTTDIQGVLESVDFKVSQPELSAIFRKQGHKNYRPCGDQFMRYFLRGLTRLIRKEK